VSLRVVARHSASTTPSIHLFKQGVPPLQDLMTRVLARLPGSPRLMPAATSRKCLNGPTDPSHSVVSLSKTDAQPDD